MLVAAGIVAVSLGLAFGVYAYYLAEREEISKGKHHALSAICDLKVKQIYQWRKERMADAARAANDELIGNVVPELLAAPENQECRAKLRELLKAEIPGYANLLLFDPSGNLLLATNDVHLLVSSTTQNAIRDALSGREAVISDFFLSEDATVHVDVAVAVRDGGGQPVAVLVLRSHACDELFSLLQFWPTESASTETVLTQREGDEVVIVNELRFAPNASMALRFPLTRTSLPAVQAALGKKGRFQGKDYRGKEVLTDLGVVPGSSWFLVSKLDQEEISTIAAYRAGVVGILIGLIILLVATGVAFFYRNRQSRILKNLLSAEKQRAEMQETYRMLFESMINGFALHEIICDADGKPADYRFLAVNPAFERMTGMKAADVVGRTVKEIMPETEPVWIERYGRVALTGAPVQFEEFSSALARHFQIRAFCPQPGRFAAVFDDITERKDSEARIARLTQLYAALSQCNQAIVRSASPDELLPTLCRVAVEFGGMAMAWIGMVDEVTGRVRVTASFGVGTEYLEGIEISLDADDPFGRGPTGTAIRENTPVWCQDFQTDPITAPWHEKAKAFGWRASAAIPLRLRQKTIGALTLYSEIPNAFDEEARNLLVEMAGDIDFAMESFARQDDSRKADEAAKREETLNRAIIESIPGTFYMLDENGRFVRWNAYERDEVVGKPDAEVAATDAIDTIHPDDRASIQMKMSGVLGNGRLENAEVRVLMRGGPEFKWFLLTGRQMVIDGRPFLLGIGIDVTARKRAEEEVNNLRTAVEQSANTIVITDPEGNIEYVNPCFEKTTGYTFAEAVGQNPRVLKSGEQDQSFYRNLWETISSGQIWRGQFHNRRKDGSLFWESATISPVFDVSGRIVHFIAVKEDITERKVLEANLLDALDRAESGNRTKSEFLAVMSHELRTPLNGVLGFAELLSESPLNQEQKQQARMIKNCGEHLLQVVNDILDFSSIERKRMKFEDAPVSIASLVESSCLPVRNTAADKGLEFRCETEPGVPEQIHGDERRIRQILINLLGNAVKFTSSGSVVLRVAKASYADRPALDFSVEDSGLGIPAETIPLLFKPFTQADSTLRRPFEGTGLGLAISQRLAEAMGGKITIISTPGRGSTFTLRLPIERAGGHPDTDVAEIAPQPVPASPGSGEVPPSGNLVLVVEDDAASRLLAGKMLEAIGWRVEFARDGQAAIDAFAPGKFSAVFMDMQMPVMDGITATRLIRETEGATETRVPIIALTANVMLGDRERCMEAGMDDFVSKPFKKDEIAACLARHCRR